MSLDSSETYSRCTKKCKGMGDKHCVLHFCWMVTFASEYVCACVGGVSHPVSESVGLQRPHFLMMLLEVRAAPATWIVESGVCRPNRTPGQSGLP